VPRPIAFSKVQLRWRLDEVKAWLRCGAPPRDEWEQLKAAQARR
jgi:hypothetical protein